MGNISLKKTLLRHVWNKESYFDVPFGEIKKTFFTNQYLIKLLKLSKKKKFKNILDFGCGDGRIIKILWREDSYFTGVDISKLAIDRAKRDFRNKINVRFIVGDVENKVFSGKFDLVYTTYALEHLENPQKAIKSIISAVKDNGVIVFLCPNFGSPFHPSGSRAISGDGLMIRALKIFLKSHNYIFNPPNNLDWGKVYPKALDVGDWKPDWDVMCEPYIQTLVSFLKKRNFNIINFSSGIEVIQKYPVKTLFSKARFFFEFLGRVGVAPYKYYGPVLFVVAKKHDQKT